MSSIFWKCENTICISDLWFLAEMARRLKFSYRKNYERKKERIKRQERKAARALALSKSLTTENGRNEESSSLVSMCIAEHKQQPSPHTQVVFCQSPFTGFAHSYKFKVVV